MELFVKCFNINAFGFSFKVFHFVYSAGQFLELLKSQLLKFRAIVLKIMNFD